jgi:outer membrane receptor protein involved in Fe transport
MIRAGLLAGSAFCSAGAPVLKAVATQSTDPLNTSPNGSSDMDAIVVTATRRETKLLEIPYNISAVTGDTLEKLGVSDITQLSRVMPGLDYPNQGAGRDPFTQPIIRGLNLSSPTNQYYPHGEVAPVSTYIGDTPVTGRFPVNDLERVEVLRGPQGTLYGAGAIAGTIRMIPNDPKIGEFSGRFESNASTIDHSREPSYGFDGVVNAPINDMLAFRLSGEYQRGAGYIDYTNVVERQNSSPISAPVLANPSDVAGSSGIRTTVKGANWSENYGGRAALLIQPTDALKVVLSLRYEHELGGGNNGVSYSFKGGADAIDPTITLAAPGKYDNLGYSTEPYKHDASLPTLDVSWDMGFATLSSNTSYFDDHGTAVSDQTLLNALFAPAIAAYYTGIPVFPRFTTPDVLSTTQRDLTEEVRLVSNGKSTIDYVVGAFFRHHQDSYTTLAYTPGAAAWDAATPAPILPIVVFAQDLGFFEDTQRSSLDRAIYGEVTYHATPTVQVTGGGRFFWQASATSSQIGASAFGAYVTDSNTFSGRGELGKMNASWDYVTDHRVYATFSQGYRPGGANGIPLAGGLAEVPALRTYSPDHVDNYEIGGKGSFGPMLAYTVDIYDMELKRAQLSTVTPTTGFPVVVNTNGARTRGAELELDGRLIDHLSYRAGYSYTDAKLTQPFSIATANGGTIGGVAGARLPGSAKVSWSGSLTYDLPIGNFNLASTAGVSHKGSIGNNLPAATSYFSLPAYTLANLNVTLSENKWHATLFVNNVTNQRAFTAGYGPNGPTGPQGALSFIETPREIGMRAGFDF